MRKILHRVSSELINLSVSILDIALAFHKGFGVVIKVLGQDQSSGYLLGS